MFFLSLLDLLDGLRHPSLRVEDAIVKDLFYYIKTNFEEQPDEEV